MHNITRTFSAWRKLRRLLNGPTLAIHYANDGWKSSRIAAIAVNDLRTGQVECFSLHQVAEKRGLSPTFDQQTLDTLEKEVLSDFAKYADRHTRSHWLHWNMRDSKYGFAAIKHRAQVLASPVAAIDPKSTSDLSSLLHPHPAPEVCVEVTIQAETNPIVTETAPPRGPFVS